MNHLTNRELFQPRWPFPEKPLSPVKEEPSPPPPPPYPYTFPYTFAAGVQHLAKQINQLSPFSYFTHRSYEHLVYNN